MKTLEKDLSGAGTADDCWHIIAKPRVTSISPMYECISAAVITKIDPILRCRERLDHTYTFVDVDYINFAHHSKSSARQLSQ